ncbi:MAG: metallophosphoesterase family protein [Thermosphaera sp.]
MRVLAFSDLHGNVDVLKMLAKRLEGENFDYMLIAGDLTNADLISDPESVLKQVYEVFHLIESLEIPYYFVWGIPFRELTIVLSLALRKASKDHPRMKAYSRKEYQDLLRIGKETESLISSLKHGKCLEHGRVESLGKYKITSTPQLVDGKTVFLVHHFKKLTNALIQIEGHVHYGQKLNNYLNLGFLYRDDSHGAKPMIGCYWVLKFDKTGVNAEWVNMGENLKEYKCPRHPEQGVFYIPVNWKKCPVCYDLRKNKELLRGKGLH